MSSLKYFIVLCTLIVIMGFLSGCSTGSVVTPDNDKRADELGTTPILISEIDKSGRPVAELGVLGEFFLDINSDPLQCELTPVRHSSLTDSLEVIDITNFMALSPCRNCARINSAGVSSDGNLVLSIGVKHPFKPGDASKPITGANRIDLHVFNVEGLVALVDGSAVVKNFPVSQIRIAPKGLINPSGYSSYLDEYLETNLETLANAHPYILHFRDYSQGNFSGFSDTGFLDVFHPSGNLVMGQGCDYDYEDYIFNVTPGISYKFLLVIECSYGVSTTTFLERFVPHYRVPQYNKKAASEVFASVKDNLLMENNLTSSATVEIKVLDMNHGVEVGPNITQMSADSSVAKISVEVPDIMSAPVELTNPVPLGGSPRDDSDPMRFEITIANELGAIAGKYPGLVAIEDAFLPGQNTAPGLTGMDGAFRVPPQYSPITALFPIDKFVTYQVFYYDVFPSMEFTQKTLMPHPRSYARAAVVDDLIYVIGGTVGISVTDPRSNVVDAYDPNSYTWTTTLAPMPTARAGMAVVAVDKKIYVIGGQLTSGSGNTDIMEIYDTELDSWSTGTPIPGPNKHGLEGVAKGPIIYVAGGFNTLDKNQKTLYRFDTGNLSWGRLNDMTAARSQFAMVLKGDYIYVVGGDPISGPGSNPTPYVEFFDTVNLTWAVPTALPRIDVTLLGPRWELVGSDIVLVGGLTKDNTLENRALLYDNLAEKFIKIGEVLIPRTSFASASWGNRIYMFGGIALSTADPPVPFLTSNTEEGIR